MRRFRLVSYCRFLGTALFTAVLAACGGGGGGSMSAPPVSQPVSGDAPAASGAARTAATTASAAAATAGVPTHVLTAALIYGSGGTPASVPLSRMTPYVTWAQTASADVAELRAAGIKVDAYTDFWRDYTTTYPISLYKDLAPGGAHADAEAKTCSGSVITDPTYGGGYVADARSAGALGHAQFALSLMGTYPADYDAVFEDDTDAWWGISLPCDYVQSSYITAVNDINTELKVPLFVNALGAVENPATNVPLVEPSNVLGAMCELCYTANGPDRAYNGTFWQDTEDAEILTAEYGKAFWAYERASGSASETTLRMYGLASFLLTYTSKDILQEAYSTPSGFPIFPESGLVPENPIGVTQYSIGGYEQSSGVFMRQYSDCYYRGVNEGQCAVVVNAGEGTESVPNTVYTHSLVLSGAGVLDGGSVSFSGPKVTSLASTTGAILFK